ncbi:hypothetical protein QJS10_CPB21g00793 [Acorus calamus]|uniref:Uncharacterized protein n=1 Tax=Acorus calamus TaxID=4465 RepID=A0AAV9C4P5_ACOCL|nr:hypothetical protein QJS10_CPB21g00793 [Acorus calamus]
MVHFDRVVKGNLSSRGEFKGVEGLSQEELFLWFPIKKFVVGEPYEGMVLIDIGMAQKQVSVSLFEEPPECRPIEGGVDRENGVVDVLADVKGTVELNAGRMEKGFEAQR